MGFSAEIVKRPRRWVRVPEGQEPPPFPKGFIVLPRRWVVERSFSWTGQNCRMSKDHERVPETGEALLHVPISHLMLRRMARLCGFSDGFQSSGCWLRPERRLPESTLHGRRTWFSSKLRENRKMGFISLDSPSTHPRSCAGHGPNSRERAFGAPGRRSLGP